MTPYEVEELEAMDPAMVVTSGRTNEMNEPVETQEDETISFGVSDEQFEQIMSDELHKHPLSEEFPFVFREGPKCLTKWRQRYRGDRLLWKRLFHREKILKEFIEASPVLDAVVQYVAAADIGDFGGKKFTIVDLASGKGFLSMFLSEMLCPSKVERFVLMDKAWPMHGTTPQPHHMSWEHIYGEVAGDEESPTKRKYIDTWPIPLTTSKQNFKHSNQRRNLEEHFLRDGPVIMLAVHLCGTLSLKAVNFFNDNPKINFFCVKPCCLPGMIHAKRHEIFLLGKHSFDSKLVCVHGKWKRNRWCGPNRSQMEPIFKVWAEQLYLGVEPEDTKKEHVFFGVQRDGGYQNNFIFAERLPSTSIVWEPLERNVCLPVAHPCQSVLPA